MIIVNGSVVKLTLCAWMLAVCAAAQAEVYKWVDESGTVHYGDAPARTGAEKLDIQPGAAVAPQDATDLQERRRRIQDWVDARERERERRREKKAQRDTELARREKRCAALRNDLRDKERGGVAWYSLNDDGSRRYYTDAEIARETEAMRRKIKDECP
jgi:hypothetical protein